MAAFSMDQPQHVPALNISSLIHQEDDAHLLRPSAREGVYCGGRTGVGIGRRNDIVSEAAVYVCDKDEVGWLLIVSNVHEWVILYSSFRWAGSDNIPEY